MNLNKNYWTSRYLSNDIPWDAGTITTPIKSYIDQLSDKNLKILIPGVGNGYELSYLYENGFKNVYGLDLSEVPLKNFHKSNPNFPKEQLIVNDFFNHSSKYDLIIEQTFFCALQPELRPLYVNKMYSLLKNNGKLVGVLFAMPFSEAGPPFGGSIDEYEQLFSKKFVVKTLQLCYNSITPRRNNEYFIILKK